MNNFIERLKILRDNALDFWNRQSQRQKMILAGATTAVLLAVIAAVIFVALNTGSPSMHPLFTNLDPEDAASIVEELKSSQTPYEITENGTAILVPKNQVFEKRMEMASQGIPTRGVVGYELFDTSRLGVTDFTQKVNLNRAKQGELARTIMSLDVVESARVMIVEPEQSLFIVEEKKPSASVAVKVAQGKTLQQDQVRGIMHLVASSIEGLEPENVTVVNSKGEILSEFDERMKLTEKLRLSELQLQHKEKIEKLYETKIMKALSKVFGENNVVVVVSAELDYDVHTKEEEVYEPVVGESGIVRSEQLIEEKYLGTGTVPEIGVPGTTSNIPGYKGLAEGNAEYNRSEETRNYEITRRLDKTEKNQGDIRRISVAVMINEDISYETEVNADGEQVAVPYINRTRLRDIRDNIEAAANLETVETFGQEARGDQIDVVAIKFTPESDYYQKELEHQRLMRRIKDISKYVLLLLVVLAVIILTVIALRSSVVREELPEEVELEPEIEEPVPVEDMLVPELTEEQRNRERVKEEVLRMINDDPEGAALIVRSWLFEDTGD